jgi:glutaminyl-tRNA synthetase
VRGTIHWVAAAHSSAAEIRLYNQLFTRPDPGAEGDFIADLNPNSLETLTEARVEPALAEATPGQPVQFERQGYFCLDPEATPGRLIFNRTVALRDSWAKARGSVA